MKKQTKMLLGIAVLLGAGYYFWNMSKKKKNFVDDKR